MYIRRVEHNFFFKIIPPPPALENWYGTKFNRKIDTLSKLETQFKPVSVKTS